MPACLAIFPITVILRLEPRCLASTRHRHCKQSYLEGVGSKHHSHMSPVLETGGKKSMVAMYHSLKGHVTSCCSNLTYESSTGPELGCLWCSKWPQSSSKNDPTLMLKSEPKGSSTWNIFGCPPYKLYPLVVFNDLLWKMAHLLQWYTNQTWLSIGNC